MRKIITFIKKYLGELFIITGTGISVYNIFNFSHATSVGLGLPSLGRTMIQGAVYYYSNITAVMIATGAMMIVIGFIIMKNKK